MSTPATYQYQCVRYSYRNLTALNTLAAQGWRVIYADAVTDGNYPDCTNTALLELATPGT